MCWLRILAIAIATVIGLTLAAPAQARIQKQMFCWEPDSEFPVGCDEEDDDDGDPSRAPPQAASDAPAGAIVKVRLRRGADPVRG